MQTPLVSIIIPTYNRAHLISETLDSVLKQTYTNWECIIVDDGSTDHTIQVLADYCAKEKRFQYFQRPKERPKGANACRNYGYELSKGTYMKWFDSDDIMLPTFLEKQVEHLKNNKKIHCSISYGATFRTDINVAKAQIPEVLNCTTTILSDFIRHKLFFSTPGPLWRRAWLNDTILFNESLLKLQDTEFHYRQLKRRLKFEFLNEPLFLIRQSDTTISATTTVAHLQSISDYYFSILSDIQNQIIPNSKRLESFVVNKHLNLSYQMIKCGKTFFMRFSIAKSLLKRLHKVFSFGNVSMMHRFKVYSGIIVVSLTRKGLLFFKLDRFNNYK